MENGVYKYATVKDVGDLELLKTKNKEDLVSAINELYSTGGGSPVDSNLAERIEYLESRAEEQKNQVDNVQNAVDDVVLSVSDNNLIIEKIEKAQEEQSATIKGLEDQSNSIVANLASKADLEYVNGQLVKKVDSESYEESYNEIRLDLSGKVDLSKHKTDYANVLSDISKKADAIDVSGLSGKVETMETDITNMEGELSTKITQTEFDDAVGVNQWIASKYPVTGTNLSQTPPSFPLIKGMTASEIMDVADSKDLTVFTGDNYIAHYFTNVRMKTAKMLTLNVNYDDSLAVYMNGAKMYENGANGHEDVQIALYLRAGWNTIELLHGQKDGTPILTLGTEISKEVEKMTTVIGVGDKNETRLYQAETELKQTNESITLKADKTEVTNIGNRVETAEAELKVQAEEISSKVGQTDFNAYSQRLSDAESTIVQHADSIATKVEQTDYNLLNDRVKSSESAISQHSDEIALTVKRDEFDGLAGRVEGTETSIVATNESIDMKADKTELDTVTGRLTDAEASIKTQAGEIELKASKSDYDNLNSRVENTEATLDIQSDAINLKANKEEVDYLNGRIESAESSLEVQSDLISTKVSQSDFDSLSIGGSNILEDSTFKRVVGGESTWDKTGSGNFYEYLSPEPDKPYSNIYRMFSTGQTSNKFYGNYSGVPINVTNSIGKDITVSFDLKVVDKGDGGTIMSARTYDSYTGTGSGASSGRQEVYDKDLSGVEFELGKWVRVSYTFKLTNPEGKFLRIIPMLQKNGELQWREIQVEVGNKDTDWSPSPADTDASLRNMSERLSHSETSINQTKDEIALKASKDEVYTKTETDGRVTDSVEGAKAEIKLTTDSITSNVETLTSTVNNQEKQITAHSSSIEQLDTSIKSKVNSTDVYTTSEVDTALGAVSNVANSAKEDAYKAVGATDNLLNTTIPELTSRVVSSESAIEQTSKEISLRVTKDEFESLQIGGRNLYVGGEGERTGSTMYNRFDNSIIKGQLGKQITFSMDAKAVDDGIHFVDLYLRDMDNSDIIEPKSQVFELNGDWKRVYFTTTITEELLARPSLAFTIRGNTFVDGGKDNAGDIAQRRIKIEVGNKATDWSPAPEDVDKAINDSVEEAKAEIKVATDSITQSVSSLESAVGEQGSSLAETKSEIKITTDAITQSVSELGKTVDSQTTQIKQTSDELALNVVKKDSVVSSINDSQEGVRISGERIDITGMVTFSALDSDTQTKIINGENASTIAEEAKSSADTATKIASSANVAVNSWKKTGTTKIDGGNIYTDSIEVGSLKSGTFSTDKFTIEGTNGGVTIDDTGVNVRNGNFTLEDEVTEMKYNVTPLRNMIKDHSFELVEGDYASLSSEGIKQNYLEISNKYSGYWNVQRGKPRVATMFAPDSSKALAIFGEKAIIVKNANYVNQYVYEGIGGGSVYTVSGFFKRQWKSSTGGIPRFEVWHCDGMGNRLAKIAGETFEPVKSDYSVARHACTFTVPTTYSVEDCLEVIVSAGDDNWVQCDGIQMVQGTLPSVYQPEDSIWTMTKGGYQIFNVDKVLWAGAWFVKASQTVVPDKSISKCRNGWILVWSDYDGGAHDYDVNYTFIPKHHVDLFTGKGVHFPLVAGTGATYITTKYLYVSHESFSGHDKNGEDLSRSICLRYVIEY